jgi:hypothetical protein
MANQVAYGFRQLTDVFDERIADLAVGVAEQAITTTIAEHNRQLNTFASLFVEPTTDYKLRYKTPNFSRLQPLDELGRARPIRPAGMYDVAFPLQKAGSALGDTYEQQVKMTVADANRAVNMLTLGDTFWMRDHILAALFTNVDWTHTDDEHGALTIHGLANGDAIQYQIQSGANAGATDTHYFAQANAIGEAADDPFPEIFEEINEHPENSGDVIALIPTNLKADVQALEGYFQASDPNIALGANANRLIGNLNTPVPGKLFGYHDAGVWLVEWKHLPDNYIIGLSNGGEKVLKQREHPEPELKGLKQEARREDYPYFERQWIRRAGFGAFNRVGALVYRIGDASYAIPTNYTSPMA